MVRDKGKRILIHLSSSSSEHDIDSDSSSLSSEDECRIIDDDDDVYEVDDDSDEEEEDEEDDDDDSCDNRRQGAGDEDDDDSLYSRVVQFVQENRDLRELSVKACKVYLRRHGLLVSGTKDVCVQRVQEHWRMKDGKAEVLYPRSSFNINCTGDVCKGDVVLFKQKVYGSFDKVTKGGKLLGKRTVAGRVVKESYGAAKQQHTFTVEVLWSQGIKKLPPLSPLLVKGRNLYRLKTYRQPWKKEAERREVLDEKHRRGRAARLTRAKKKKSRSTDTGRKSQKVLHSAGPSQTNSSRRGKCTFKDRRASCSKHPTTCVSYLQPAGRQEAGAHRTKATYSKPFLRDETLECTLARDSFQIYSQPPFQSFHRRMPFGSNAPAFQRVIPCHDPPMMPAVRYNGNNFKPFLHSSYEHQSLHMTGRRDNGLFSCSIRGCHQFGSDGCVIAACWNCCIREGVRCYVHR